jgi:hypothetical protein
MPKPVLPVGCLIRVIADDVSILPVCREDVGEIVEDLGLFRMAIGMVYTYRVQFLHRRSIVFGCAWDQYLLDEDEIEPLD